MLNPVSQGPGEEDNLEPDPDALEVLRVNRSHGYGSTPLQLCSHQQVRQMGLIFLGFLCLDPCQDVEVKKRPKESLSGILLHSDRGNHAAQDTERGMVRLGNQSQPASKNLHFFRVERLILRFFSPICRPLHVSCQFILCGRKKDCLSFFSSHLRGICSCAHILSS